MCVDFAKYTSEISECSRCDKNSQCPDKSCVSMTTGHIACEGCVVGAIRSGVNSCDASAPPPPPPPTKSPSPSSSPVIPDCVSTSWLNENGFGDGILKERGMASVLCIPGFSCATPGHLLKVCLSERQGKCRHVTVREYCNTVGGCAASTEHVSRMKNNYNWTQAHTRDVNGNIVFLTSVSVGSESKSFSISRGIAHVALRLNEAGHGSLCDHVVLSILKLDRMLRKFAAFPELGKKDL